MQLIDTKVSFWNTPTLWRNGYYEELTPVIQRPFLPTEFELETQEIVPTIVLTNQVHSRQDLMMLKSFIPMYNSKVIAAIYADHRESDFAFFLEEAKAIDNIKAYQMRLSSKDKYDNAFEKALWYVQEQHKLLEIWAEISEIHLIEPKIKSYKGPVIIDQMGNPDIKNGKMLKWQNALRSLSRNDNIYIKLSGLLTMAHWRYWKFEDILPYVEFVISLFGSQRIIFGSDWPYHKLAGSYNDLLNLNHQLQTHTEMDLKAFYFNNAKDIYGL